MNNNSEKIPNNIVHIDELRKQADEKRNAGIAESIGSKPHEVQSPKDQVPNIEFIDSKGGIKQPNYEIPEIKKTLEETEPKPNGSPAIVNTVTAHVGEAARFLDKERRSLERSIVDDPEAKGRDTGYSFKKGDEALSYLNQRLAKKVRKAA